MRKQQAVAQLAERLGKTKTECYPIYDTWCSMIREAIESGDDVHLVGVGKIYLAESDARNGRNPTTGEPVEVPAKTRIRFRAAWPLKCAVADVKPLNLGDDSDAAE